MSSTNFSKIIDELILQEKNEERKLLYKMLRSRFPALLKELEMEILTHNLNPESIAKAMAISEEKAIDIGDALIYLLIKERKLDAIATLDKDWKRLNVRILEV